MRWYPVATVSFLTVALVFAPVFSPLQAATYRLEPSGSSLQEIMPGLQDGDVVSLAPGRFQAPLQIKKSVRITGEPGTHIEGDGEGHVIYVDAPDVVIEGLKITGSGLSLAEEHSGIYATANADRLLVAHNQLRGNLIGINIKGPQDAQIIGNDIEGRTDLRVNERGNGVQLWNTPGTLVDDNRISFGRDGIFVTTSRDNRFSNNHFSQLRFAVHYMYTNHSEISGNYSEDNHVAYALMYSSYLKVHGNQSHGDRDRGIFFNFTNYSSIQNNRVTGGVEKCAFVYNSNTNQIVSNHFEGCSIGIHFTAGSENNEIWGNNFISNRTQVKYVGTRSLEWSKAGTGNYWSDQLAFDLDANSVADKPYRPNSLVDQIVWRYPLAKSLLNSPALQLLQWAQSQFPALHPGGVQDSVPRMQPFPIGP